MQTYFDIEDGKKKREFQYVLLDQKIKLVGVHIGRTFMLPITLLVKSCGMINFFNTEKINV